MSLFTATSLKHAIVAVSSYRPERRLDRKDILHMSICFDLQPLTSWSSLRRRLGRRTTRALRRVVTRTKLVVASFSPQTTDRLLTIDDLVADLASGCKNRHNFKIGTEHEKLGFNTADCSRINYGQIEHLLRNMEQRFGWTSIMDKDKLMALTKDGQKVTLEPGGQLELSGAPLDNVHQTAAEINSHLFQVKIIAEKMDVAFLAIGVDPIWNLAQTPVMPNERHDILRNFISAKGKHGVDVMSRTCSIQVNLDFESESDMIEKYRIGLALQPVVTALFANSPFAERNPTGSYFWRQTDPARCGNLPVVFDDNFGFERYVDYALDAPMYLISRLSAQLKFLAISNGSDHSPEKEGYIPALGQSFRDFMNGKCTALPNAYATIDDWRNHLVAVYPEVRLKTYLEMRGADGGPWRFICGLPAFWVGLLYDPVAQSKALDLISDWTQEERNYMYEQVAITGLKTPFRDGTVLDIARESLEICKGGLERRGLDEMSFLKELEQIVETAMTQADVLLHKYHNEWNESVEPIYTEFRL